MRVFPSLLICVALAGCSPPALAVRGDSTAIASRDGAAKAFNFAPSLDSKRWWNIVRKSNFAGRSAYNDGVGGQSIATMREKMEADQKHRSLPTVIYDRRNEGETADQYEAELARAIGTLSPKCLLIMPQVSRSAGLPETDPLQVPVMADIDRRVRLRWAKYAPPKAEADQLIKELSDDATRYDGLHRNAKGQAIEARYISTWLKRQGC